MKSIYQRELGDSFEDLHSKVQRRFGFTSEDGVAAIGRGTMRYVRNGGWPVRPFLWLGSTHATMFPEEDTDVPFAVRNDAYRDEFGRETVSWVRRFQLPKTREFNEAMIYSEDRDGIVVYLGETHHLAVDIDLEVSAVGGIQLTSGAQRLYAFGLDGWRFPLALSARADVHEWYDEDLERYRIEVDVSNRFLGRVFEYVGTFDVDWIECESVPPENLPTRATRGE